MKIKSFTAALMITMLLACNVSFAARGGARMPAPSRAPAITHSAPASPSGKTSGTAGSQREYKPSKDAASLNKNAQTKTPEKNTAVNSSSSHWGSALRNVGLFAGGMFLGSMLGSMFGMGGLMSEILGMIFNVIIVAAIILFIMVLWHKFSSKKNKNRDNDTNIYKTKSKKEKIIDVRPLNDDLYERKAKADEYRRK